MEVVKYLHEAGGKELLMLTNKVSYFTACAYTVPKSGILSPVLGFMLL